MRIAGRSVNMIDSVERLYELLEDNGMTLHSLCRMTGLNHSTLSAARRRHSQLSLDTIDRACKALDISVSEFFAEKETQSYG